MPQIFTRTPSGLSGQIRTLSVRCDLFIAPAEPSETENAPDYRVHLDDEDGPEVGAGWKHTGEKAGEYIAIELTDPFLAKAGRAVLFRDDDEGAVWSLHWQRPQKRDGKN